MIKNYFKLFLFFLLFWANISFAQQNELWNKVEKSVVNFSRLQKNTTLEKYQTFELNLKDFKKDMRNAPLESVDIESSKFKMQFPDEKGKLVAFWVKEAPVMDSDLAKKFPNNKSYIGYGVEDNSLNIRFSVNVLGLYAMIIDKNRQVQYIDPIGQNRNFYKIFNRGDLSVEENDFQCHVEKSLALGKMTLDNDFIYPNDLKLRTYRLALAATGEYSQFQLDISGIDQSTTTDEEKKEVVLAAMTIAITRVNAIFENDMAIRMQLVSNNTDIIFLDADTDPYTNSDGSAMLDQNQNTCDNEIGTTNYDVGHVFSTGGGGVAWLAGACKNGDKAGGVTGSSIPTGDNFYYDFVAHELGHQFGANHTFNGNTGICTDIERNEPTAVEPGSGSTLMAYGGFCAPQNVQEHSGLYFHAISIDEMWTNITTGGSNCATETNLTSNLNTPTANAGNDFAIPKSTAYKLIGQGSDADGDPITFGWEQLDNEINSVPPSDTDTNGTIYRSWEPITSNIRYLPKLGTVNSGSLSSTWEVTPSVGRKMNFNLTVRDNNKQAGQIAMDAMVITVSDAAGPFIVTSQNTTGIVWTSGNSENITWDVAGTNSNGINTSTVNILLSIDGGETYPTVLASNVPNNGSQNIIVPDLLAPSCKIMVEAVGNLFYSLNQNSFSIGEFTTECTTYISTDVPKDIPDNDTNGIISTIDVVVDNPIVDVNVSVSLTHTWIDDITLILESPEGTRVKLISGECGSNEGMDVTFDDEGDVLICGNLPAISGIIKPEEPLLNFFSESPIGVWKLITIDNAPDDNGTIDSWSLELCTSQPLGVDFGELTNFALYPNPSHGEINISFLKDVNKVEMTLYDLLGRKINEKLYTKPTQSFDEIIDFSHIAKGIYILRIKNGNHFSSKKIQLQ